MSMSSHLVHRRSWIGLGLLIAGLAAGCDGVRNAAPDLEEIAYETRWPTCLRKHIEEMRASCPSESAPAGPAAHCEPRDEAAWPPPVAALEPRPEIVAPAGAAEPLVRADERFEEAQTEPRRWRGARDGYRASLASRDAAVRAYAGYKLAFVDLALGDVAAARASARQALRDASLTNDAMLITAARAAFVRLVARSGDTENAWDDLRPLSGDHGAERAGTVALVEELAVALVAEGAKRRAIDLLHELADRDGARHACVHRAHATSVAWLTGSRATVAEELEGLLDGQRDLEGGARTECGPVVARAVLESADRWYGEGLGGASAPLTASGVRDREALELAAWLYGSAVSTFDDEVVAASGICRPRPELAYQHADLVFALGDWHGCGSAYELALGLDPTGPRAHDAAFAAVACRRQAWASDRQVLPGLAQRARMEAQIQNTEDWRRLLFATHRYLCIARRDDGPRLAETAYARAEALEEGGDLWQAAVAFRLVAYKHPDAQVGVLAAERYAEAMDSLVAGDVCRLEVGADLVRLSSAYCGGENGSVPCQTLARVLRGMGLGGPQL
jgi:tetratricopeptide (TPR) repeat protein